MTTEQGPDAGGARALPGGVRFDVTDRVATVLLDRPEVKNAQSFATWASLARIGSELIPESVDVVVIRGAGADFSAGLDLRQLRRGGMPGEGAIEEVRRAGTQGRTARIAEFQRAFSCWRELDAVVVAVVQGRAIGAGFQLALAADLRIAADDAVFTMAEPKLGLVPDLGGTHRLTELVGYSRALQICATVEPVPAARALEWGLVNTCVAPDRLSDEVDALVRTLTAHRPGLTHRLKRLLRSAATVDYVDQLVVEAAMQATLLDAVGEPPE